MTAESRLVEGSWLRRETGNEDRVVLAHSWWGGDLRAALSGHPDIHQTCASYCFLCCIHATNLPFFWNHHLPWKYHLQQGRWDFYLSHLVQVQREVNVHTPGLQLLDLVYTCCMLWHGTTMVSGWIRKWKWEELLTKERGNIFAGKIIVGKILCWCPNDITQTLRVISQKNNFTWYITYCTCMLLLFLQHHVGLQVKVTIHTYGLDIALQVGTKRTLGA